MNISQKKIKTLLLPLLEKSERIYRKSQPIHAYIADENEHITTTLDGKKETENKANKGDYVVKNLTFSGEQYIVPEEKFYQLYSFSKNIDQKWDEYIPQGEIKVLNVDQELLSLLKSSSPFYINTPWGELQLVEKGDKLVTPLPNKNEIYRIANSAFKETYQPKN